jgi:hypothetical protein
MMDRRRHLRSGADLPALSPADMDEIVRTVAATLRQIRELEVERLRFALSQLELFRDEMAAWNAGMRAVVAKLSERPLAGSPAAATRALSSYT